MNKVVEARGSFSPKMYKLCSNVLNVPIDTILGEIQDPDQVSYRTSDDNQNVKDTVAAANMLFNEIIMQQKIGVR